MAVSNTSIAVDEDAYTALHANAGAAAVDVVVTPHVAGFYRWMLAAAQPAADADAYHFFEGGRSYTVSVPAGVTLYARRSEAGIGRFAVTAQA